MILESTVLGVPVDTQTYIKTVISTHYDRGNKFTSSRPWGKDNLAYLYALFENDVPKEDYALASVMLQEYVSTVSHENFENPTKASASHSITKQSKRKRRSSKDKSRRKSSRS